ncbi:protein FAR1-RELATED SEQUENCE 5-like [Triticum dicoccoides]|uniref:protein FAR1-RELATED SEQUENCE 5-like n=1 Tax=Triticum dicoccoides TaxID=85692 RepID=UPI000E7C4F5F|nr:protein FAR1-RELATED SEQUENCE 5-like [Triticum dicoccoides]XP_037457608.1 protein FAR1-RELATED SEQUENCE 5-like [Triticum dicoccoides]
MKCNKWGKTKEMEKDCIVPMRKSTVIAKTDCKVVMVISEKGGLWEITRQQLEHNHELTPNSRFFRSHKYMLDEEKCLIRVLKHTNLETRRIVAVLAYLRGGMAHLPYTKKHITNYAATVNRDIAISDMMEVVQMFNKKQEENPGFCYLFELDGENKVRSLFWTDVRSRMMYDICGDCISFNTTFLTNRYNLPFASFVGISPHGNTYLFACAFIVNETKETFAWLFEQFLMAMGGKHPISIITDQDKAMQAAIEKVFPNATHRSCIFHIKKKAKEKVGPCFQANEGLYEDFQDIVDNSLTVEEFETHWPEMIEKYKVHHIKYFNDMWENRKKLIPVYFKDKFFLFIQTTARSEGTNSLFKKGVGAKFSATSFLREYDRILDVVHDREEECDHVCRNKKVAQKAFWSKYSIERQAHELYNIGIFRKFQFKISDTTWLHVFEQEKDKNYIVAQAENYPIKELRKRLYLVQVGLKEEEYSCICCAFQKYGLMCSHILRVMIHLNIEKIPEKYIIDRWRKNDYKLDITKAPAVAAENSTLRYNVLARKLMHVASIASKKKRKYEYLLGELDRINKRLREMDDEEETMDEGQSATTRTVTFIPTAGEGERSTSSFTIQDPDVAKTKGRPRMLTIREAIKQSKFYKCSHCGSQRHTVKNCTNLDKVYNKPKGKQPKQSNPRNVKKGGDNKRSSQRDNGKNTTTQHNPEAEPSGRSEVNKLTIT